MDDEEIRNMNKLYLKRDNPTNVLAFSMIEGEFGTINPDILGDIVISVQTALRDAEASGMSLYDEIDFLVIHGILHLLGYNHEYTSEEEKKRMESKEREIFYHVKGYEIE